MKSPFRVVMLLSLILLVLGIGRYGVSAQTTRIDEKFDSVTPPNFPTGWSVDVPDIGGVWTWQTTAGVYNPASPGPPSTPNVATFQSYNLPSGSTARLITPTMNWSAVTLPTFTFKYRRSNNNSGFVDVVYIDASVDNGVTWDEIAGPYSRVVPPPTAAYWEDISVAGAALTPYAGQASVKFAFRAVSGWGNWIHIDNVFIGQPAVNDVGITTISAPGASIFRTAQTITASVKNFGSANQTTYNVHVKTWKTVGGLEGSPEFERVQAGPSVTAGSTVSFSFTDQWTPAEYGGYTVKVYTELTGDETPGNDAMTKSVTVNPAIDLQVTAIVYPPTTGLYTGTLGYSVRGSVKNNGTSSALGTDYTVEAWIGPTLGFPGSATYHGTATFRPDIAAGATVNVDMLTAWVPVEPGAHTVRIKVTMIGDEIRSNDSLDAARTVNSLHYGGPDGGGYYYANSTPGGSGAPSQPTYNWIDPIASGHTAITTWTGGTGDDGNFLIPDIGFDFTFYGNIYRAANVYIGANGLMTFGAGNTPSTYGVNIPNTAAPNNLVAGCWMDLDTRGTTYPGAAVYYGGDASKFVATWLRVHRYGGATDSISFQVILYANGNIKMQYNDLLSTSPLPASINDDAVAGIENSTGTSGTGYRNNGVGGPIISSPVAVEYGTNQASLPVQIVSFTGRVLPSGGGVKLDWVTISEINNYGFYVERKINSQSQYQLVPNSFVPGHGTTNVPQYYSYTDSAATPGVWYYRLKQIDLDGTVHFTDAIQVDILTSVGELAPREFALFQNYPNPFNPNTTIIYQIPSQSHVTLTVFDILSREVATLVKGVEEPGYKSVQWDASGVASGVYFYRLDAGSFTSVKKLVLLR